MDTILIEKWLKVHEFWYEILPNKLFDECSRMHDADLNSKKSSVNRHVFDSLLEKNIKYYKSLNPNNQNKSSTSKSNFSHLFFTIYLFLIRFSLKIFIFWKIF